MERDVEVGTVDDELRALVSALVPPMRERDSGVVVNVTSMVAFKGVAGASSYSASKAAMESFTRTWAVEFGKNGVRVLFQPHNRGKGAAVRSV